MKGKKELGSIVVGIVLLSVLVAAAIVKDEEKKQYLIYSAICLSIVLIIVMFSMMGRKEYKKVEHSGSNLSLDNSDEETEKEETEGEKQPPLSSSVSCPERLTNETASAEEVRDSAKEIKSTMVKEDENKTNNYYNLTNQQLSIKNFGKDESIIAVTFPENYSIKKYENGKEIKSTKDGIIDDGDKYKPIDFSVNKTEKVNDKGKNEDSYQFTFKFQSVQKDNVYIEINCETLNVYSGWEKNEEKSVTQYFKDLNIKAEEAQEEISKKGAEIKTKELKKLKERAVKVNDDFLIFLDVGKILSGSLGAIVKFVGKLFPANVQGLSSVTAEKIFKHFDVELSDKEKNSYINIKDYHLFSKNKKNENSAKDDKKYNKSKAELPILDILASNQLINKKQEVEQERADDISQVTQIAKPNVQNEVVDEQTNNSPQPQNKEDEANLPNANSVPPSPSISSGIGSCAISSSSTSDIATTELEVECVEKGENDKKQPIRKSISVSSGLGSQGSIDSTGKQKRKFEEKAKKLFGKVKGVLTQNKSKEGDEGSIDGNEKQKKKFSFKKILTKSNKGSKETSPLPFVDTFSTVSADGIDNQGFAKDW